VSVVARLKLRLSYTRLTWGLAKRCAAPRRLLGSAHLRVSPVRTESPLLCRVFGYSRTGLSFIVSQAIALRQAGTERRLPVPFFLLAVLLVIVIVVLLLAVYFVVRHWL